MYKTNKKKIISLVFIFSFALLIFYNLESFRYFLRKNLPPGLKDTLKELIFSKEYFDEIYFFKKINYNQRILPKTQFENLSFQKIKLDIVLQEDNWDKVKNKYYVANKFFISQTNDNLLIVTTSGQIQFVNSNDFTNIKKIGSNLKNFNIYDILDIEVINANLYISFAKRLNSNSECQTVQIIKASVNTKKLIFENFFEIDKCLKGKTGGRMVHYFLDTIEGMLFSTGAYTEESNLAQDDNSLFGKILFIDFKEQNYEIISKGHRNPQGLLANDNIILSTEHGPFGGDEINKIVINGNYGWPNASYGENYKYDSLILKDRNDYSFKKNHADFNFNEPIYSFVPSIGISEIIKVPENFSKYWINNYLITSLNGRSLYRVLFDKSYSKIIYSEKIPIGERIRDIKFIPQINSFILALEESGSLGILKVE